jgi:cation transport ATPase
MTHRTPDEQEQLLRRDVGLHRGLAEEERCGDFVADGVNDAPRADADVGIAMGRGGRRQASRGSAASVVRQLAHVRKASLVILLI